MAEPSSTDEKKELLEKVKQLGIKYLEAAR
jgi:hypothetical protein